MIAYLTGKLVEKRPTEVVIEVHGVGYHVHIPTSTFDHLPSIGTETKLHTYQYVREDALLLYGFVSGTEKALFAVMLGASGVGPKLALAALSAMRPNELTASLTTGNVAALTTIPGVGRKTAERLVLELRDRIGGMEIPGDVITASLSAGDPKNERADALAALESLGLSRAAAEKALQRVIRNNPEAVSADELVRFALRER